MLCFISNADEFKPINNKGEITMSLHNDTWLIQRLNKPKGYKNPWGDINNEVKDVDISDIIDPDYMGAAEYEWGIYNECIETMQKYGTTRRTIYIYPKHKNVVVNIVNVNGCEENEVDEQTHKQFVRFSVGTFENRAIMKITKSKLKKIN